MTFSFDLSTPNSSVISCRCYGLMSITFILAVFSTAMGHLLVVLRVAVLWDRQRVSLLSVFLGYLYHAVSHTHTDSQKIMKTLLISFALTVIVEFILVIGTVATSEHNLHLERISR